MMTKGQTILVVEDADEIRRLVCGMLALQDYHCLAAADGVAALQLIESGAEKVDLVLTDMVMPKMTGAELARHISRSNPEIRIVLMSGFSEDPLIRCFQQVPAIFISKPFTAADLCAKVRAALDQPWPGLPNLYAGSTQK
jgi:CheY-like chemotaxis protein